MAVAYLRAACDTCCTKWSPLLLCIDSRKSQPCGGTPRAKLIVAAPLDYLPWIKPVDDFARRTDLKGAERWLLVSGKTTPRATQELTTLGWRVSDNLASAR